MSEDRTIAFHATQHWANRCPPWSGFILLSVTEASQLEKALRLARTGKLNVVRGVTVKTHRAEYIENPVTKTRIDVKGYDPEATR